MVSIPCHLSGMSERQTATAYDSYYVVVSEYRQVGNYSLLN